MKDSEGCICVQYSLRHGELNPTQAPQVDTLQNCSAKGRGNWGIYPPTPSLLKVTPRVLYPHNFRTCPPHHLSPCLTLQLENAPEKPFACKELVSGHLQAGPEHKQQVI